MRLPKGLHTSRSLGLCSATTVRPPSPCAAQANNKEEEAKFAEAVAARVALRKRAEEMAAMARGDIPKVTNYFQGALEHKKTCV